MTNLIKLHDFCFICHDIKVALSLPPAAGLAKPGKLAQGKLLSVLFQAGLQLHSTLRAGEGVSSK